MERGTLRNPFEPGGFFREFSADTFFRFLWSAGGYVVFE